MTKKFIFLSLPLFSCLVLATAQPRPTDLPVFPEMQQEILAQKEKTKEYIQISPIVWDMNWYSGIQQISMEPFPTLDGVYTSLTEVDYTSNQYKGAVISVDIRPIFTIYSTLSIGFPQGLFPRNFSTDNMPYQHTEWTTLESDSFVARKIQVRETIHIAPFVGYNFAQYELHPISPTGEKTNRVYHSVVVGSKFIFQPHRIFFIESSISFSPVTAIDSDLLAMFQINYETIFSFATRNLTLSLILSSRNNIEYEGRNPDAGTLKVSKTGFRFKFSL